MADWCFAFDFVNNGSQGWEIAYRGTFNSSGAHSTCANHPLDPQNMYEGVDIFYSFQTPITLIRINMEFYCDPSLNAHLLEAYIALNGTGAGSGNPTRVEHHATTTQGDFNLPWNGAQALDYIELGVYVGLRTNSSQCPGGEGIIKSITLWGTGENPFAEDESHDAADQKAALDDAFDAIRDALHTNPTANITTLVTAYKDEIESAFGVTFDKQSSSDAKDWEANLLSLHFARCGLEATAEAFEKWVEAQILEQNVCKSVDRYVLFQRIIGNLTLKNMPDTRINIAKSIGDTIEVYQRPTERTGYKECVQIDGDDEIILGQVLENDPCPTGTDFSRQAYNRDGNNVLIDTDRQGVMTPNNLIHELGHTLDGFAGFGVKKIGSLYNAIDNTTLGGGTSLHNGYSRDGMGEAHLRVQYYEHAHITNNDGVAEFDSFALPTGFDQSGYLQYDLFNTYYSLWNSDYNIYRVINMNVRIDTFAINSAQSPEETVADAFLSWVRQAFEGTAGSDWQDFFANNIGIFLRNAAIHQIGMVQHYQAIGLIPLSPIVISTNFATNYLLRLAPQEVDATILGASSGLPSNVPIYGWLDAGGTLGDGISTYWLLVADGLNRLLWIAAGGVAHTESQVKAQPAVSSGILAQLNPIRAYSDTDLLTIIGS